MPIQSQGIITRDNVSVDVSAVAYYRVEDAVRSVVAIENVAAAIDQIAQTTLRAVVGRHTLDETLSETDTINQNIREILDVQTEDWGVKVTVVELKDIQLPESMKRAMARQAEAEREKRAKIIAAEGEALAAGELGHASDVMMAHPLALQLRNLQTMVEIGVDKNSTIVFPAPLMSTIGELGAFLARENAAADDRPPLRQPPPPRPTATWSWHDHLRRRSGPLPAVRRRRPIRAPGQSEDGSCGELSRGRSDAACRHARRRRGPSSPCTGPPDRSDGSAALRGALPLRGPSVPRGLTRSLVDYHRVAPRFDPLGSAFFPDPTLGRHGRRDRNRSATNTDAAEERRCPTEHLVRRTGPAPLRNRRR